MNPGLRRGPGGHNDTQTPLADSSTGQFLSLEVFLLARLAKFYGFSLFIGSTVYTYQEPHLGLCHNSSIYFFNVSFCINRKSAKRQKDKSYVLDH